MAEGPIDTRITELEHRLDRLRVAFEQHFLGNERLPPVAERDKFMRDLRAIDPTKVSAVPRFRLANLTARVSTYDMHWQKTLRAIEEGTYARDKFKADLHARHRAAAPPAQSPAPPEQSPAPPAQPPASETCAPQVTARARAAEVADEATAFLDSLRGAPLAPLPMRGAPVAPRPPAAPPAVPMRGAPVAPPPAGKPPGESR
jgi:hypothetical protein